MQSNGERPYGIYPIGRCPECGGWAAWHTAQAFGMWHDHDGRRVNFERVELVELSDITIDVESLVGKHVREITFEHDAKVSSNWIENPGRGEQGPYYLDDGIQITITRSFR